MYYFPEDAMPGDIDNIVKPVLDALSRHVYLDDRQVERVVVQKFEPEHGFPFSSPGAILKQASSRQRPLLYVRLSGDPHEDLT